MGSRTSKKLWPEVTKERPCPICGKDHRCKLAEDGLAAICFRCSNGDGIAPFGWRKTKQSPRGGAEFHHSEKQSHSRRKTPKQRTAPAVVLSSARSGESAPAQSAPIEPAGTGEPAALTESPALAEATESNAEPQQASADDCDRVYDALLGRWSLSDSHRQQLRDRGFTDKAIEKGGYKTKPAKTCIVDCATIRKRVGQAIFDAVPGVWQGRSLGMTEKGGIVIPVRAVGGQVTALRLRLDDPGEGGKYRWITSRAGDEDGPSPGTPVHVPLGVTSPSPLVRVTEGEFKADFCSQVDALPTISIPGVNLWERAFPVLEELKVKTVRVAFDADASTNVDVSRNLVLFIEALVAKGIAVELERWDPSDGKGIDDLLRADKQPEVLVGDAAVAATKEMHVAALAAAKEIHAAAIAANPPKRKPSDVVLERLAESLKLGKQTIYDDTSLLQDVADLSVCEPPAYAKARELIRAAGLTTKLFNHAIKRYEDEAIKRYPAVVVRNEKGGFFEKDAQYCRTKRTPLGPETVPLGNFIATITDETTHDDGVEQRIAFGIAGNLCSGEPLARVEIAANDFTEGKWVTGAWGSRPIIWPGEQQAMLAAIRVFSPTAKRQFVYGHTGWRNIGGNWAYLHNGGAIAAAGVKLDVTVSLPSPLNNYTLPDPPTGEALKSAIRASLKLLEIKPSAVMFPLFAAIYRAVLRPTDLSLFLVGRTGTGKTELTALAQQHFGPAMDARRLPGNWSSTANSLESMAFQAKDALLAVDDFIPAGSSSDVQRLHRDADRLLRAQGNNSGRQRMRADGSLRPVKPPRGMIIGTGEDIPRGQSLQARMFIVEVTKADGVPPKLTPFQTDAASGKYAQAMAGFIRWLAPNYDAIQKNWPNKLDALRTDAAGVGDHARTPSIVAELSLGFRWFAKFAADIGAITQTERRSLVKDCWTALKSTAEAQTSHQQESNPARRFIQLVTAVLASGRGHVADKGGDPPADTAERWGWRRADYRGPHGVLEYRWQSQGKRIGWLDGTTVYLEPDSCLAAVQQLASEQGESFSTSGFTLRKQLWDDGFLSETEKATRGTLTVRPTLEGQRRKVLAVRMNCFEVEAAAADKAGKEDAADKAAGESPSPDAPNESPAADEPGEREPAAAAGAPAEAVAMAPAEAAVNGTSYQVEDKPEYVSDWDTTST